MIQVEQTIFAPPLGNCYAACVASIFEVPLSAVPHPTADEGTDKDGWARYTARMHREFFVPRGLAEITFPAPDNRWHPMGYAILGALSPRFEGELHAVVTLDGRIVWDPHPGRDQEVGERRDWTIFYVTDPAENEFIRAALADRPRRKE